jgi:hypothetical protein
MNQSRGGSGNNLSVVGGFVTQQHKSFAHIYYSQRSPKDKNLIHGQSNNLINLSTEKRVNGKPLQKPLYTPSPFVHE